MQGALTLLLLVGAVVADDYYGNDYSDDMGMPYRGRDLDPDLFKRLDSYLSPQYDSDQDVPPMIASRSPGDTSLRDKEFLAHAPNAAAQQHQEEPEALADEENKIESSAPKDMGLDDPLPFYCHPPNPCPKGHTSADGCTEHVADTAAVQRRYIEGMQNRGICSCDQEHMFHCKRKGRVINTEKGHEQRDELDDILDNLMDDEAYKYKVSGNKREYIVAKKSPVVKRSVHLDAEEMMELPYEQPHRVQKKSMQMQP